MDIALSLVVLTIIALALGALTLFKRGGYRRQAVLMLILAGVMAINVAIWSMPVAGNKPVLSRAPTPQD